MDKGVLKKQFWKDRLNAIPDPEYIHHSVLACSKDVWTKLHLMHVTLIHKHIDVKKNNVLDLACGYGRLSKYFNNYIGVDLSPDLLAIAKRHNSTKIFLEADGRSLPFEDKQFDWTVIVSLKVMIISNCGDTVWSEIEKEILRVSNKCLVLEYGDLLPEASGVSQSTNFIPNYEIIDQDKTTKHYIKFKE
tara:strand:+ start:1291 stop:1860 length:570 start_codon:yes stop_codon:yes gene_type:complete